MNLKICVTFQVVLLSVAFWSNALPLFSQKTDSTYISDFEYNFGVTMGVSSNFQIVNQELNEGVAQNNSYLPMSITPGVEVGVYWKKSMLKTSYIVGLFLDNNNSISKSYDFQYHYYGRKIVYDLFFHKTRGFRQEYDSPGSASPTFKEFPGMSVTSYGLFAQYVPNGNRFSHGAAFSLNAKQRKSSGSFLVGGGIYQTEVRNASDTLLGQIKPKNLQMGANVGYVYTRALGKHFFVTGSISVGANVGLMGSDNKKVKIHPQIYPRIAAGYKNGPWAAAISGQNNKIYIHRSSDFNMSVDMNNFQISVIRFFKTYPKKLDKLPKWIQYL